MKTTGRILLLFLFLTLTLFMLSQEEEEWKWRDYYVWGTGKWKVLERTDYSGYVFNDKVDFRRSVFDSTANFDGAKFNSAASFSETQFDSTADFLVAQFASRADFSVVQFKSTTVFSVAQFYSATDFINAHFYSTATFVEVQFNSTAIFRGAQFDSTANFEGAKFNSAASFSETQFDLTAIFCWAQFNGEVFFTDVTLPKFLDFSQADRIASEIDLTKSLINPEYDTCYINLTDAAIDKFRFRYKRFKLWFPPEDSIGYELKANVYEELLLMQKKEGFTKSYEILDKEYREFQYTDPNGDYSWFYGHTLNWLEKNWWGYGYDKELIIRNVILIYLLLSFINAFMLRHLTTQVYTNEKIERLWASERGRNWFIGGFNSLWYSLFYTAVIFFSFRFDMEKLNYEGNLKGWKKLNLVYFFTIYLGGIVCLAYLANYIITV